MVYVKYGHYTEKNKYWKIGREKKDEWFGIGRGMKKVRGSIRNGATFGEINLQATTLTGRGK
jgi:hypothetical protein